MRWIITAAAVFLAGCQSEGQQAEKEYRLAEKHALDHRELCEPARKAAAAYLRQGDEHRYEHWHIMVTVHCT